MANQRVRPFERADIPAVVALRKQAFGATQQPTPQAAEAYFDLIFFGNPWRDLGLPALVFEDQTGSVTGFLGVIPRPMLWQGKPVRVAVSTQFMVDPRAGAIAALRL